MRTPSVLCILNPSFVRSLQRGCLAGLVVFGAIGCSSQPSNRFSHNDGPLPSGTDGPVACVDLDGDGFGPGCSAGNDCNDNDPKITAQCRQCTYPGQRGCLCASPGERVACGKVVEHIGDQLICGQGESVCQSGIWSECVINNTLSLPVAQSHSAPGVSAQGLGQPSGCTDPCNPYCKTWNDTPTDLDDPDGDTSITDQGVTLPQGEVSEVPNVCSGGAYRQCEHHLCQNGTALSVGCDTAQLPCTERNFQGRTYLFCENALPWEQAESFCQSQNMHLATINNDAENQWLGSQAESMSNFSWWLGFNDRDFEGDFGWQDGSASSYLHWNENEPAIPMGMKIVPKFMLLANTIGTMFLAKPIAVLCVKALLLPPVVCKPFVPHVRSVVR
jgi:hypothetical protein